MLWCLMLHCHPYVEEVGNLNIPDVMGIMLCCDFYLACVCFIVFVPQGIGVFWTSFDGEADIS